MQNCHVPRIPLESATHRIFANIRFNACNPNRKPFPRHTIHSQGLAIAVCMHFALGHHEPRPPPHPPCKSSRHIGTQPSPPLGRPAFPISPPCSDNRLILSHAIIMIIHNQPLEMQKAELPRFARPPPLIYIWFLAIFPPFSALTRSVVVRWPFGRAPPLVSGPPLGGRRASFVLLACPPFFGSFIVPLPPPVVRAKRSSQNTENPPCGSHICASPCGAVRSTLAHN